MAQTDYILRMIEQMGQVLAELRNMILGKDASAEVIADKLPEAAAQNGFDLALARAASAETIEMLLLKPKGLFLGLPEAAARISEVATRLATPGEQQ